MSPAVHIRPTDTGKLSRFCRSLAALMPALIISYSALVDPLINFDAVQAVQFDVGPTSFEPEVKSTFLTKIIMLAFLALSFLLAVLARPVIPNRLRVLAVPGILLLSLAGFSAFWAAFPMNTLTLAAYQAILYGSLLVFVAVADDPRRIMRYMLLLFALVVAVNLAALLLRPPGPIGHQGIYSFKNLLGAAAGCAFLFGLFNLFEGRLLWRIAAWFTTLGAVVLIVASGSKTVIALAIAAPVFAAALYATNRLLALSSVLAGALLLALCVSGFITISAMLGFDMADILLAIYGDTTFTGRTDLWSFTYDHIQQSPLFGNGFRSFWSLGAASPSSGSEIHFIRVSGSSHNGFLDIALDLGLAGLGLLILFILAALHMAAKFDLRPTYRSLFYVAVIVFVMGRNMMETVLFWTTFFDHLSFLLVSFLACYRESPSGMRFHVKTRPGVVRRAKFGTPAFPSKL